MTKRLPCCDRKGFTYVIRCRDFIKIGSAKDVRERLIELRVGNPFELDLLAYSNGSELERVLHHLCSAYNHRGEWFHIDLWKLIEPLFTYDRCAACLVLTRNVSTESRDAVLRGAIGEALGSPLLGKVIAPPPLPTWKRFRRAAQAPKDEDDKPTTSKRTRVMRGRNGRRIVITK